MTSPKVESKKQVTYTNAQAVPQRTAPKTSVPLFITQNTQNDELMGLQVEKKQPNTKNNNQIQEIYLQSGRKIVIEKLSDGRSVRKHYSVDGKLLKPDYFKKVEGDIKVSSDGKSYTVTKDGQTKTYQTKISVEVKIAQEQARLNKEKKQQGPIGKSWDWMKNTIGFGDSSNEAQAQLDAEKNLLKQIQNGKVSKKDFKEVTGLDCTRENIQKFKNGKLNLKSTEKINAYKEGQEIAVDITSDIVSGVVAYGTAAACVAGGIAAAPFTAGASLGAVAVGVGIAAGAGAATKVGIKSCEAAIGGKKYKTGWKDATIGAVSGALAPVTLGVGGAITKSLGKGFAATSVRLAAEGGTFGFADGTTRSALEGNSIGDVALDGLKGAGIGIVAGNILGHGGNVLGKTSSRVIKNIKSKTCFMNIMSNIKKTNSDNYDIIAKYVGEDIEKAGIAQNILNLNLRKGNIRSLFIDINSISSKLPNFDKMISALINNGSDEKSIIRFVCRIKELPIKNSQSCIDLNKFNTLLQAGCDENKLYAYCRMHLKGQNKNAQKLLEEYSNTWISEDDIVGRHSSDITDEIYVLLKELELDKQPVSLTKLKEIFENYKFQDIKVQSYFDNGAQQQFQTSYLIQQDKNLIESIRKLMDTISMNEKETISNYFQRLVSIQNKNMQNTINTRNQIIRETIEQGYSSKNEPLQKISLSSEEEKLLQQRGINYYIREAGDVTTQPGAYTPRSYTVRESYDKLTALGLQKYPRYNSTSYLKSKFSDYKYEPLYRFLSPKRGSVEDFMLKYFPREGELCQFGTLQCCSPNPYAASGESAFNSISCPVQMIIHPKNATSKAHFIGGNGEEVRYGGNVVFKVIKKYTEIQEYFSGFNQESPQRNVVGVVVLQEI